MGAKPWRASSDGPDWTDIAVCLREIGTTHGVVLALAILASPFEGCSLRWTIAATGMPREASVLGNPVTALSGEWPCKDHAQLTHCVYAGCLRMDAVLTEKLAKQSQMLFTA